MKIFSFILTAMMFTTIAQAKIYTLSSGKWSDSCIWSENYAGATIKAGDVVIVTGQVVLNVHLVVEGTLRIEKGATLLGAKDITIAQSGVFVNNGSTIVGRIMNEGAVSNNLFMETKADIQNCSMMENYNAIVAGNNFESLGGKASGKDSRYYANKAITQCDSTEFAPGVAVLCTTVAEKSEPAPAAVKP